MADQRALIRLEALVEVNKESTLKQLKAVEKQIQDFGDHLEIKIGNSSKMTKDSALELVQQLEQTIETSFSKIDLSPVLNNLFTGLIDAESLSGAEALANQMEQILRLQGNLEFIRQNFRQKSPIVDYLQILSPDQFDKYMTQLTSFKEIFLKDAGALTNGGKIRKEYLSFFNAINDALVLTEKKTNSLIEAFSTLQKTEIMPNPDAVKRAVMSSAFMDESQLTGQIESLMTSVNNRNIYELLTYLSAFKYKTGKEFFDNEHSFSGFLETVRATNALDTRKHNVKGSSVEANEQRQNTYILKYWDNINKLTTPLFSFLKEFATIDKSALNGQINRFLDNSKATPEDRQKQISQGGHAPRRATTEQELNPEIQLKSVDEMVSDIKEGLVKEGQNIEAPVNLTASDDSVNGLVNQLTAALENVPVFPSLDEDSIPVLREQLSNGLKGTPVELGLSEQTIPNLKSQLNEKLSDVELSVSKIDTSKAVESINDNAQKNNELVAKDIVQPIDEASDAFLNEMGRLRKGFDYEVTKWEAEKPFGPLTKKENLGTVPYKDIHSYLKNRDFTFKDGYYVADTGASKLRLTPLEDDIEEITKRVRKKFASQLVTKYLNDPSTLNEQVEQPQQVQQQLTEIPREVPITVKIDQESINEQVDQIRQTMSSVGTTTLYLDFEVNKDSVTDVDNKTYQLKESLTQTLGDIPVAYKVNEDSIAAVKSNAEQLKTDLATELSDTKIQVSELDATKATIKAGTVQAISTSKAISIEKGKVDKSAIPSISYKGAKEEDLISQRIENYQQLIAIEEDYQKLSIKNNRKIDEELKYQDLGKKRSRLIKQNSKIKKELESRGVTLDSEQSKELSSYQNRWEEERNRMASAKEAVKAREKAEQTKKDAEEARKKAEIDAAKAEQEAKEARERAEKEEEKARKEAEKARVKAEKEAKKIEKENREKAEREAKEAEKIREKAEKEARIQAEKEAKAAKEAKEKAEKEAREQAEKEAKALKEQRGKIEKDYGKKFVEDKLDASLQGKNGASTILDKFSAIGETEGLANLKTASSELEEAIKNLSEVFNSDGSLKADKNIDEVNKLVTAYQTAVANVNECKKAVVQAGSEENKLLDSLVQQQKRVKEIESTIGKKYTEGKLGEVLYGNKGANSTLENFQSVKESSQDLKDLEAKSSELSEVIAELQTKFDKEGKLVNPKDITDVEELIKKYQTLSTEINNIQAKIKSPNSEANNLLATFNKNEAKKNAKEAEQKAQQEALDALNAKVSKMHENSGLDANLQRMQDFVDKYVGQQSESLDKAKASLEAYRTAYNDYINSLREGATEEEVARGQSEENLELLINGYSVFKNQMVLVKSELNESAVAIDGISASDKMLAWLENNTRAARVYGEEVKNLAKQWDEAVTQIERTNIEKKFANIQTMANSKGLTGDTFGNGLLNTFGKIAQFTGIYRLINNVAFQAPRQMWSVIQEINKAQIELQKVTTATGNELANYYDKANESAQKYGATLTDVINSTADWQRLGYNLPDSTYLSDMTILMQKIGDNMTQESSSQGMISTLQGFQMQAEEAGKIVDVINQVANTSPIDTAGLFQALEKSASSLSAAGNTFEESVALITGANSILQNPNIVGNGLKTMTMRIRGAKTELEEAGEDIEGMADTTASLRSSLIALSGVDIMLDESTFKSTYQILDELAQKWQSLSDIQQAAITEKIAGKRQGNLMSGIMNNFDTVRKALNSGMYEAEGSAERELEHWNEGIEASLAHLSAQFQSLTSSLADTGLIKLVIDTLTAILKLITDITDATNGLATVIMGGGIIAFFKNFKELVKIGEEAKAAGSLFKTASAVKEVAEGMQDVASSGGAVSKGIGLITGSFGKLGTAITGVLSAGLSNIPMVLGGGALALLGVGIAKFIVDQKKLKQELITGANDAKEVWNETTSSVEDYITQYETLNAQLNSLSVTDPEYISTKQQLYDLQNNIIDQFGEEANGISLVNGAYDKQLGLLRDIKQEKAKGLLEENGKEYRRVKEDIENPVGPLFTGYLMTDFDPAKFGGNAFKRQADISNYIKELNKEYSQATDKTTKKRLEKTINVAEKYEDYYNELIRNEGEAYKSYLETFLAASGNGDVLSNYQNAITQLNTALRSGDEAQTEKALKTYEEAKVAVEELNTANLQYNDTFEDVSVLFEDSAKWLDTIALRQRDFTKNLKDGESGLEKYAKVLKGVDRAELFEYLKTGAFRKDTNQMASWFRTLARESGFTFDELQEGSTATNAFISALVDSGYVIGDYSDNVRKAKEAYEEFAVSTQKAIENVSNITDLLGASLAGTFTADNAKAFRSIFGDDAQKALEKTTDGYHLNRKALEELTDQQKMAQRMNYLEALEDSFNELAKIEAQLKDTDPTDEDTIRKLTNSRDSVNEYIQSLKDLQLEYEAVNSKYQNFLRAQSSANEDDMYNTIRSSYESMKAIADEGRFGNDDIKAYVDLLTFKDMSNASAKEVMQAWDNLDTKIQGTTYSVKDFLAEGNDGAYNYVEAINQINEAWAHQDKEGNWILDFDNKELAKAMGVSQEFIDAMDRMLIEYGFDMKLNSQPAFDSIEDVKKGLEGLSQYLEGTGLEFTPTLTGTDLDEEIRKVKKARDELATVDNKDKNQLDTYNALNLALEYYIKKKMEANETELETKDVSNASEEVQKAAEYLNAYRKAKSDVEATKLMNGDDADSLDAVNKKLEAAKTNLKYIGLEEGKKLAMSLGLDVDSKASAEDVQKQLSDYMDKHPVKFFTLLDDAAFKQEVEKGSEIVRRAFDGITIFGSNGESWTVKVDGDTSGLNNAVSEAKEDLQTIPKEETTALKGDSTDIEKKRARVINSLETIPKSETVSIKAKDYVSSTVNTIKNKLAGIRDKVINITTKKSTSGFSTANEATGTAFASGNWGTRDNGTALVGELGQELLVRNGRFYTIGDDGAEFINYRKGDILFNATQTASLFKYGGIRGANPRGKAFASGTAFDSGTGGFLRQRTSTATTSKATNTVSNKSKNASTKSKAASKNSFSELLDEIEIRIANLEQEIESFASVADNAFELFSRRNNAIIDELETVGKEIRANQLGYVRYMEEANAVGLDEKWAKLVREGAIDIDQITDEKLWKKIEEYKEWTEKANECLLKVDELKVKEAELYRQRFDLVDTMYQKVIEEIQHSVDVMDSFVSLTEAQSHFVSGQYYERMIQSEEKILSEIEAQRDALISSLEDAVASGRVKQYSEEWYDMNQTINELCNSIIEAKTSMAEWQNEIRQLRFDAFDALQETISEINNEVEFLYNLLDENKMFDDKGKATDVGLAAFGLSATSFDTYMQLANNYADELKNIQAELANDPNNQTLIDRQKELTEAQRDAIENARKQRDAIVNLVENGIKKEIDALKKTIDEYEKLLDTQKDESDYAKSIAEEQKNIDKLRKRLSVAENDNSEEGAANRQKLRNELREAEESLQEKQQDRQLSQTKEMLSELQTQYEDLLNGRLDDVDKLIADVIDEVNNSASQISDAILTVSQDVGYTLSDSMMTTLSSADDNLKAMVSDFHDGNFINNVTSINDAIQKLVAISEEQQRFAEAEAARNLAEENARHEAQEAAMARASAEAAKGHWRIDENGRYYERPDGTMPAGGFETINDKVYAFDERGYVQTGWQKKDNKWYYMNAEGERQTGWLTDNNKRYYLDTASGQMYTGLQNVDGKLYYFDSTNGEAKTGLQTVNKQKYLFDASTGEALTGWQTVGKSKYYFDPTSSQAKTGWVQVGDQWFYMGTDGIMKTGWQKINKKYYYLDKTTGAMQTGWIQIGSKWYYTDSTGARVSGKTITIDGKKYKFNSSGVLTSKKYASGTKHVPATGIYNLDEEGTEFKLSDGSTLKKLYTGDMVFNKEATQNLWDAANNPAKFISKYFPNMGAVNRNTASSGNNVTIQFNLSGLKNPEEFMSALQKNKKFEQLVQELSIGRMNGHGALKKYAI